MLPLAWIKSASSPPALGTRKPALVLFSLLVPAGSYAAIEDWLHTLFAGCPAPCCFNYVLLLKEPIDGHSRWFSRGGTAIMLYLIRDEKKYLLLYFALLSARAAPVLLLMLFPAVCPPVAALRMLVLPRSLEGPAGLCFHTTQSLIAVGTRAVRGLATWRAGKISFNLPEPAYRILVANIAEELVLLGAVGHHRAVLMLGSRTAYVIPGRRTPSRASSPCGITATILYPAFFNVTWCCRCATKGITLRGGWRGGFHL